jgi:hypothetical protein
MSIAKRQNIAPRISLLQGRPLEPRHLHPLQRLPDEEQVQQLQPQVRPQELLHGKRLQFQVIRQNFIMAEVVVEVEQQLRYPEPPDRPVLVPEKLQERNLGEKVPIRLRKFLN